MFRLIRLVAYVAALSFFYRVAFPNTGTTGIYDMVSMIILLGGAVGIFIMMKVIDMSSQGVALAVEAAFAAAVFVYLGLTLPQAKGLAPLQQMLKGEHPTQSTARDGFAKLGLDSNSQTARLVIGLFPKS